ncbi:MAG: hypothetical protein HYX40_11210 [Sphingobacteriales bacterium]|nr:hypothetical protein [Sphingobacteriales bacterium]
MKFYSLLILLPAIFYTSACKQQKPQQKEQKQKDFLPVTDFLAGEIRHIDSIPYAFTNFITIGDKTDSAFINKELFHTMVNEFLEVNITDKKHIDYYDETSLIDTSINMAIFTYLANSPDMKVARIDAYIDPGSGKFRKVFIKRIYNNKDTTWEKQLLWQTSGNFSLITRQVVNDKEFIKQERVVWDDKKE